MECFSEKAEFNLPVTSLFDWHVRNGAFERLSPPWRPLYIVSKHGSIQEGGIVTVKLPVAGGLGFKWQVRHKNYAKNKTFTDTQVKGFFSHWEHRHNFFDMGNKSALEDIVYYKLPLGPFGSILSKIIHNNFGPMFGYRHRVTKMDLEAHFAFNNANIKSILVTGSSGFVGSALVPFLTTGGYDITRLLRTTKSTPKGDYDIAKRIYQGKTTTRNTVSNPSKGSESQEGLTSTDADWKFDAVVNLNGENIFGLWSGGKKKRIFDSRVKFTQSLCKSLSEMDKPPKVLISASAIGIYGNNSGRIFDDKGEDDDPDGDYDLMSSETRTENNDKEEHDFLSNLCREWEEATDIAKSAGIRIVNLRMGLVLGASGGMIKKLATLNKLKVNITTGHNNWLCWISLDDLLRVILFCICNENISGPVNAVSPSFIKYSDFMEILGRTWATKLNINIPSKIVEILGREMARYTILSNTRATPKKILSHGFSFALEHPEMALRHTLGKIPAQTNKGMIVG
ncbi:MAG: DUF1731 domain-containing protein [Thermoproteota archaeon]|nr:DUF1731 domain-containing protein [Thermoproteota archaeon]